MSAATAKTADPSMEEILASIRRIIADDEGADVRNAAPAKDVVPETKPEHDEGEQEDGDVLDLAAISDVKGEAPDLGTVEPDLSFEELPQPAAPEQVEAVSPEPPPVELPLAAVAREVRDIPRVASVSARPPQQAAPEPSPIEAPFQEPQAVPASADGIISQEATASVGQAFNLLSHTIMNQNTNTLEDIVREMLKPMLKTWLDDNLPPLVERLVAAEIQRVARGQR